MTLCSACQCIFKNPEWRSETLKGDSWYFHSDSPTSIKNGRRNGCPICAMVAVHYDIDSIALDQNIHTEYNIHNVVMQMRCSLNDSSRQRLIMATKRVYVMEPEQEPRRIGGAAPTEDLEDDGDLSPMNTAFSKRQAKIWMNECLRNHDICNQSLMNQQWWPNRLLDLDAPDLPDAVRLISTTDSSPSGPYMTLSHRWGTAKFIKLTTDSLHSFKLGIPLKDLPKTFQDAVAVAKWFGVRYLWIDSLCIIQDSIADWSVEAGLMSEVYQCAFCNIAATGALDSSEGLFFNRDFNLVRRSNLKIDVPTDWRGSGKSRQMEILNPDLWKESIQQTELNKRGWVVQERLLARRVLHFGKMQQFWECREQRACETYPNGLHYVITTDVDFRSAMLASVADPVKGFGKEGIWWSIVRIYSQGQLTRLLDKEMACSGIVKSLETTFKDSCIVGLWKKGMPFQLLWESGYLSTRCPYYRAPSWSWLSVDGEISAGPMEGDSTLISNVLVEDIVVTRAGQQNGDRIKSAYIKLKGYVKNAKLEIQLSTGHLTIDDCHSQKLYVFIDGRVSKWGSGSGNVCCLLISSQPGIEKEFKRRGLILRQTSHPEHKGEVYERVGTFQFEESSKDQPTELFSQQPYKRTGFSNNSNHDRDETAPMKTIVIV